MTDDYADLLGPHEPAPTGPPKRKPGRPSKAYKAALAEWEASEARRSAAAPPAPTVGEILAFAAEAGDPTDNLPAPGRPPDAADLHRPVTRTYLATVLNVHPRHLVKQLGNCPTIGRGSKGEPLYDFREACSYILEPKIDILVWLKSQNAMSLPPHINKAFWDAMRSRQMVEERAGDLWRTGDVLEVLARTAMTIKETATLWVEALPGKDLLTTEQYESIRGNVNDLLNEVHRRLVEMPMLGATHATSAEFEKMVREGVGKSEEEA